MVNFENGQLVKGAYVVIDGKEYTVHMPQYSGQTPLSSENMNKLQDDLLKTVFPIGSKYITQTNTNPNEILGFGTWERLKGKVCLGLDENDSDFNEIGKTGGSKTHKHTTSILGGSFELNKAGCHFINSSTTDAVANKNYESSTVSNMPLYEIVGYMWIRRS